MSAPDTIDLLAAVEPIAAYVARTPPPNKHADRCATLVDAVADYVDEVEQAAEARAAEPDWQALAYRIVASLDIPGYQPTPLMLRCWAFLDRPRVKTRAALPLAQRLYLAQINSHYLGPPDYLL